jgi:hypothetical protein
MPITRRWLADALESGASLLDRDNIKGSRTAPSLSEFMAVIIGAVEPPKKSQKPLIFRIERIRVMRATLEYLFRPA